MDLDRFASGTPPFITLDACNGKRAEQVIKALESHKNGDTEEWTRLVQKDPAIEQRLKKQGIETPVSYTHLTLPTIYSV